MDKISSILPSNARITTVDTNSMKAVRAGAPRFDGDPNLRGVEAAPSLSAIDRVSLSNALEERRAVDAKATGRNLENEFFRSRQVSSEFEEPEARLSVRA